MEAVVAGSVVSTSMCMAIIVFYYTLNNQSEQSPISQQPLSETTLSQQLADAQTALDNKKVYSNIFSAQLGFPDNNTIMKTLTIDEPLTCKAVCDITPKCLGFQIYPSGTSCDLLSNVSNTYSFVEDGWNLYLNANETQHKIFGNPLKNQEVSGSMLGSNIPDVKNIHTCGMLCTSNSACVSFSAGSGGCELFTDQMAIRVPNTSFDTYPVLPAETSTPVWP